METEQIKTEMEKDLILIPTHRGDKRKDLIERVANNFIMLSKQNNLLAFPRDHINNLISNDCERQKERIATAIINLLKDKKAVREITIKRVYYGFQRKTLMSQDYGSYKVLIDRNKNKPENKQGCYSMGNKSYYKFKAVTRDIKVYELI